MEKKKVVKLENKEHSYFYSLELGGINCFRDNQTLDLSDKQGNYSPWTIILGDNGTGKTTLLRVLDRMQPFQNLLITDVDDLGKLPIGLYDIFTKSKTLPDNINVKLKLFNKNGLAPDIISIYDNKVKVYTDLISNVFLLSYGASRRMSKNQNISSNDKNENKITSLFDESIELINAEEWFLQKEWASIKSVGITKQKFENDFNLVKDILVDILPDVSDIQSKPINENNSKPILEVETSYGWVSLRNLSFGYQTLTALIVDIASKMMEQYPNSANPLEEPAVILIDEIDLHLHPKWQRTVIDKLSQHFPKAQFIATSHSPLIVQAALDKKANIVVCRKEGDKVVIDNDPDEVKGWRIDQILTSDLFELSSSKSVSFEEMRNEKTRILLKDELTDSDNKTLEFLNKKLNIGPVFSSKEGIDAEELIKKAAELLKK